MVEGIRVAAESSPDAIVVVTDGDTPWPREEPEVPITDRADEGEQLQPTAELGGDCEG